MTTAAQLKEIADGLTKAAADLARATTNVQQHVDKKAQEIGDVRGVQYAKTAREQIDDVTKQAAIEIERRDAVVAELRLQLEVLAQQASEGRKAKARLDAVRVVKVWRDDLGRRFVYCDDLWHATDPEHNPPPQPVRLDKEN